MESTGKFDFSRTMKSPWMSLHLLVASSLWEGPTTHNTPSVCWGGSFSPVCYQDCRVCWQGALGPSLSPKLGHDPDRLRQRQRAASALQAPAKVGDGFPAVQCLHEVASLFWKYPCGLCHRQGRVPKAGVPRGRGIRETFNVLSLEWCGFVLK